MRLLVSDANIFIDFEAGEILHHLFALPEAIGVPDLLFEGELREQHGKLLDLGLQLIELGHRAIERTAILAQRYSRPSRMDLAALALAEQESCPLITGDRRLREAAEREGVEVHGTLWVGERLAMAGVLGVDDLHAAYVRMRSSGRRLPWAEVESQIRRLRESLI